jgi:HSP20 family protein
MFSTRSPACASGRLDEILKVLTYEIEEVTMRIHSTPSLFDRFFDEAFAHAPVARPFRPALDLIEYSDRYEVVADLPGVDQTAVEVEFIEGALHIRGERACDTHGEEARAYRRERAAGSFERSIGFRDDVEVDAIEASFRDGVLRVRVPKSEKNKPRQIPVTVN